MFQGVDVNKTVLTIDWISWEIFQLNFDGMEYEFLELKIVEETGVLYSIYDVVKTSEKCNFIFLVFKYTKFSFNWKSISLICYCCDFHEISGFTELSNDSSFNVFNFFIIYSELTWTRSKNFLSTGCLIEEFSVYG